MKRSNIFITVFAVVAVNLAILLTYRFTQKDTRLSWWLGIDALILIGLAMIPVVNYAALVVAVGILFFTIWTKGLPVLNWFINRGKE